MSQLVQELWLQSKLRDVGAKVNAFSGTTDPKTRREHFRGVIRNGGYMEQPSSEGGPTFAALFRATYGEAL